MTVHAAHGLPDPVADAAFYEGLALRRLIALAADGAAVAALALAATLVAAAATLGAALVLAWPIWFATGFLYRWLTVARAGATPGMWLAGVELRGLDGERPGETAAMIHAGAFCAAWLFVLPQIASVVLMAARPDGRGLHDRAAGLAMINRPA